MVSEVALAVVHDRLTTPPAETGFGVAVRVTVTGFALTVTVTLDCT